MSSILRALKKLDVESALQKNENERQAEKQIIKMKRLVNQHTLSSLTINKFLFALLSLLVLGIVGWLTIHVIHTTGKSGLERNQDLQTPASNERLLKESLPDERSTEHSRPSANVSDSENSRVSHPINIDNIEKPISPEENTFTGVTSNKLDRKNKEDRKEDRKDDAEHAEDVNNTKTSGLKLTGIVWSEMPERRLALINDKYLKEGDKIKGAEIIRIEKDGITLQAGTKTWTIGLTK